MSNRHLSESRQQEPERNRSHSVHPSHLLDEVQSLLDAAQRISSAPVPQILEGGYEDGPVDVQPNTYAAGARTTILEGSQSRPHVPDEDSGSDIEDARVTDRLMDQLRRSQQDLYAIRARMNTRLNAAASDRSAALLDQDNEDIVQTLSRSEHNLRVANRHLEARRLQARQALNSLYTRGAELDEHLENLESRLHTYTTSDAVPAREAIYDWAIDTRSVPGNGRRWRPSERLQDFAFTSRREGSAANESVSPRTIHATQPASLGNAMEQAENMQQRLGEQIQQYRRMRMAGWNRFASGNNDVHTPGPRSSPRIEPSASDEPRVERNINSLTEHLYRDTSDTSHSQNTELFERANRRRLRRAAINERSSSVALATGPLFDNAEGDSDAGPERAWPSNRRLNSRTIPRARALLTQEHWDTINKARLALNHLASNSEHVFDVPRVANSTWLEAGMRWSGTQSADNSNERQRQLREGSLEFRRRVEEVVARQEYISRQHQRLLRAEQSSDPAERALLGGIIDATSVADTLNGANLRSAPQSNNNILNTGIPSSTHHEQNDWDPTVWRTFQDINEESTIRLENSVNPGRWKVKVRLHEVNMENMTLSGTMAASQFPPNGARNSESNSMNSFFVGEIIDFITHSLITPTDEFRLEDKSAISIQEAGKLPTEWYPGGIVADLLYWSHLGPFKEYIDDLHEKRIRAKQTLNEEQYVLNETVVDERSAEAYKNLLERIPDTRDRNTHPHHNSIKISPEDRIAAFPEMLTNKEWLDEHIGKKGWILMRWKEKCFIDQSKSTSSPTAPAHNDASSATDPLRTVPFLLRPRNRYRDNLAAIRAARAQGNRIWSTNIDEQTERRTERQTQTNTMITTGQVNDSSTSDSRQWGLTINGFYYVALNRQSGRIEALYFDNSGAKVRHGHLDHLADHELQRLVMMPETHSGGEEKGDVQHAEDEIVLEDRKIDFTKFEGMGGLRTSFSVIEYA